MAMALNQEEQNRVNNVYNEREKALSENNQLYGDLMNQAGELKNQQNAFLAQQQQTQNDILDKQLANQGNLINQQKEEANRNRRVEAGKAMNDYNAYVNPYGIQAERQASAGLTNSGVSETSKLGAYTSYQNRVANANANYQKAVTQYDNAMNEAMLNNDVQKAQNALNMLKLQLENNQDYYSNISSLSQAKMKNAQSLRSEYNDQYNTVYNQIMNEQQRAEAIRQFNEEMAFNKDKYNESVRQFNEQMALDRAKQAEAIRQFNEELALSKKKIASGGGSGGSGKKIKVESPVENNINGSSNGDQMLYTNYTPDLTNKRAQDWYFKSIDGKQLTYNQLKGLISDGLKGITYGKETGQPFISDTDAEIILKTYGAK